MDQVIYRLLLKTAQGLALPGTLRYRYSNINPVKAVDLAKVAGADIGSTLTQLQQQTQIDLDVYLVEGSVSIPLLTGFQAVPIAGIALVSFLGPPIATITTSTDPASKLFFQFNQIDSDHMAGGLVRRPGEPGELIFSILGTEQESPT